MAGLGRQTEARWGPSRLAGFAGYECPGRRRGFDVDGRRGAARLVGEAGAAGEVRGARAV